MGSTSVRLIHYSDRPVELNACSYLQYRIHKPNGLWVSVEGYSDDMNWRDWCLGEGFRLETLAYRHEVKLKNEVDILHLYDKADIEYFTKEYGIEKGTQIHWRKLAKLYKGIIIAPYCWACRLNPKTFWYYSFDCASGCIWDLSAIASFTLLPQAGFQSTSGQCT